MNFLRLGGVSGYLFRDDVVRDAFQVIEQGAIHFFELGHKRLLDKRPWHSCHDRVAPLPTVAIRFDSVSSEERDEDLPRPGIVHREPVLFGTLLLCDKLQLRPDALPGAGCCVALSRRSGTSVESLNLTQRFEQSLAIFHPPDPTFFRG